MQCRAAKMRGFLLILFFTFIAPLQCSKSNYFFVTRRDTKEAVCIRPNNLFATPPFPTFDLDKLKIPSSGFKYWDWLSDWQLQNDRNVRRGDKSVLIAGNQPFHFLAHDMARVSILASNVSLWLADKYQPHRGAGMLFELDHLNETTKLKDTTSKFCDRNPEIKGAECTILDYKKGTNFLNDGNRWTLFAIKLKENRAGVEMFEESYGKEKPVVQCTTWKNAIISYPIQPHLRLAVFAKSHQRNAAFYYNFGFFYAGLSSNIEMKRNYTKRSSGKFCVEVEWNKDFSKDYSNELMQVKNLASGRVQPATNTNTTHKEYLTYFRWNHLDAGEYEFTLRFDKRQPMFIDLCQDDVSMMKRTWTSIPKAITKCQFTVSRYSSDAEFSAGPSSPPDPTLKPIWSLEAWEHVCDRLGIGSNDTEVPIKFCNKKGCNFSKCPHLQHEPAYIFDF